MVIDSPMVLHRPIESTHLAAGCAPRTVSHIRAVLRTALNDAVKTDLLGRNVATVASPPRVPAAALTPMTSAEVHAILAATTTTRIGAIVATALYTGLRQGEILGLRWADVDLDRARSGSTWPCSGSPGTSNS
jgi:integrase